MKKISLVILLVLMMALMGGCGDNDGNNPATGTPADSSGNQDPRYQGYEAYLLPGYPEEVPLLDSLAIDACIFAVRNDPQWVTVEGGLRNFYHAIYYTKTSPEEVLEKYQRLMNTIDAGNTFGGQAQGTIGEYEVFVNTTAGEGENTVYVTVDLPKEVLVEENPFFTDFPQELVQVEPIFTIFDQRYYVSSNGNGEIKYVNHYEMPVVESEFYDYYRERYQEKPNFNISDSGVISWEDQGYKIVFGYQEEYKRSILNISKPLD